MSKKPVCVVDSAESVKAIHEIMKDNYIVTSYPNLFDLEDYHGRTMLLWPDNNDKSKSKMLILAEKLENYSDIKFINLQNITPEAKPHQIISPKWTWNDLFKWAKTRAYPHKSTALAEIKKPSASGSAKVVEPPFVEILPPEHLQEVVPVDEYSDVDAIDSTKLAVWTDLRLDLNGKNAPYLNAANVCKVLSSDLFDKRIWFEEFSQKIWTNITPKWTNLYDKPSNYQREWSDNDDLELLNYIQTKMQIHTMGKAAVKDAVSMYAHRNSFDVAVEYINSLSWDENPRVESFFIDAFGADDTPYTRAASKNFWIGMVRRIFSPGTKVDNMIILEGKQGLRKTTAVEAIAGEAWYGTNDEELGSKDFQISLLGKLVVELTELDYFNKSSIETVKRVLSNRHDRFRPPYGHHEQVFPRRCVFIGTTNKYDYLQDPTGGRRFWPVKCSKVDIDYIKSQRDQLFAEAYDYVLAEEPHWIMPELETEAEQLKRFIYDDRSIKVIEWVHTNSLTQFRLYDCAIHALGYHANQMDRKTQTAVGKILASLPLEKGRRNHGFVYTLKDGFPSMEEIDSDFYRSDSETEDAQVLDDKEKPLRSESEGPNLTNYPESLPF